MSKKNVENATCVLVLTESSRKFLRVTNFHHVDDDAAYVAFFEDGNAMFLTKEEFNPGLDLGFGTSVMLRYFTDVKFEIEY